MRASPASLSWLGGSVVLGNPLESVDPDDCTRAPVPFEHVAVVPIIE
jgi:hypothetical protein